MFVSNNHIKSEFPLLGTIAPAAVGTLQNKSVLVIDPSYQGKKEFVAGSDAYGMAGIGLGPFIAAILVVFCFCVSLVITALVALIKRDLKATLITGGVTIGGTIGLGLLYFSGVNIPKKK